LTRTEPPTEPHRRINNREHNIQVTTILSFAELKGIIATDLQGSFPTTSGQGNSYVMVMYDYDSNTINAVAIKNRKKESLIMASSGSLRLSENVRVSFLFCRGGAQ
jgi:hypothetical protein